MEKYNEYIEEAVKTLFEISADAKKRQEYEAREKEIRDYNARLKSEERRGYEQGLERGRIEGREFAVKVIELKSGGMSAKQIAMELDLPLDYVKRLVK